MEGNNLPLCRPLILGGGETAYSKGIGGKYYKGLRMSNRANHSTSVPRTATTSPIPLGTVPNDG